MTDHQLNSLVSIRPPPRRDSLYDILPLQTVVLAVCSPDPSFERLYQSVYTHVVRNGADKTYEALLKILRQQRLSQEQLDLLNDSCSLLFRDGAKLRFTLDDLRIGS